VFIFMFHSTANSGETEFSDMKGRAIHVSFCHSCGTQSDLGYVFLKKSYWP